MRGLQTNIVALRSAVVLAAVLLCAAAPARDEVLREMRQTTAEMAMDIAEQIIRKGLGASHQRRLLNELVEEIRSRESGVS